jgi:hypothetical protein
MYYYEDKMADMRQSLSVGTLLFHQQQCEKYALFHIVINVLGLAVGILNTCKVTITTMG